MPSVVRIAGNGDCSDFAFFSSTRIGRRCRSSVMAADAVILQNAAAERQWISEGGSAARVHRIPIGIGPSMETGLSSRNHLRRSLTRINGDMFVPDSCSVVLSVERMRRDSGLMRLVESAYSLTQKITGLQFWLVGDGTHRETIFARLKSDGLRQVTSMPGSFGLMEDVFAAADLMIHFGDEGFEHQIPTAISSALPLVLANTPTAREFFSISDNDVRRQFIDNRRDVKQCPGDPEDAPGKDDSPGELVWWFDPDRPKTLRFAIDQIVDNFELARNRSGQLRKTLQRVRSRRESIDSFARLFRRLVESKLTASDRDSSVEKTQ
jgi:glycosyltransferase involved in cell wall biosynthesis